MKNRIDGESVEIAPGIYWVGTLKEQRGLDCNPYLIIEEENGILIDPGSIIDFETVLKNVEELIPIEKIKYIILHHQDPDLCSSTPLFEKAGFSGEIVTHWRTSLFIQYYGIKSPIYIVNENSFILKLSERRTLKFIPAAYMHFPGALMTYDPQEQILFSGDVFGAISYKRILWADDNYKEAMKVFHENYIPSNDVMRPVMENLLKLPIIMIAPQHGSIIKGYESVIAHIKILRKLECGNSMKAESKSLEEAGSYTGLCNQILDRYYAIYSREQVTSIFEETGIILDEETGMIIDYTITGRELWSAFFQLIYSRRSIKWLTAVENLVQMFVSEFDVELPHTFDSILYSNQKQIQDMDDSNRELRIETQKIKSQLKETTDQLMLCPITGLYNERFFFQFLHSKFKDQDLNFVVLFIVVDNFTEISSKYDKKTGDEVLKGVGYLLLNYLKKNNTITTYLAAKLNEPVFSLFTLIQNTDDTLDMARELQEIISSSDIFIEPATVSIGIIDSGSVSNTDSEDQCVQELITRGQARAMAAERSGGGSICDYSVLPQLLNTRGKVVVIESDPFLIDALIFKIGEMGVEIMVAGNGHEGLKLIEKELPDVIICELNIPQLDGFNIKRALSSSTQLNSIPFILIARQKTEETILKAVEFNIQHYFKKPLSLFEVTGLVKNLLRKRS